MATLREPSGDSISRFLPLPGAGAPSLGVLPQNPAWRVDCDERALLPLTRGLLASGGMVSGDTLVTILRKHRDQPLSWLARSIVRREVLHVPWRSQVLVPMFQFDPGSMQVRDGAKEAMAILAKAFDNWELATWFAEPNSWLGDHRPADLVGVDDRAVIDAARADWFVAIGP